MMTIPGHGVPMELAGTYDASGLAWGGAGRPFGVVVDGTENWAVR